MKKITFISLVCLMCTSLFAAQLPTNISPQQIEQFKKLSPAQQQTLAKSMGVDINTIRSQLNSSDTKPTNTTSNLQQYYPRGTQYDDMGNPLEIPDEKIEEETDEPKPFGYEVFANAPFTFAPVMDMAVPESYIIGPGDALNIQMFGKENNEYELAVSREGKIIIPELGAFNVSGMDFSEAKRFLKNQIKNKVLGVDVILTLSELRSIRVFVLGEAFKPGNYVLNSLSSVTHAIFAAGGISEIGSLRNIQLKRAGKLIKNIDLYDFLIKGDSSDDLQLKSGDVVFIAPIGNTITIDGEVKRPAIYELKGSDSIANVIDMAGGLLPSAYPSSTIIERYNNQNLRSIVNIDLSVKSSLSEPVKAGDYIKVMKTSENYEKSVSLIGAVSRPGNYQWKANQRISDLLPSATSSLLENADLTYSIIVREIGQGRNIEVLQFNLTEVLYNYESEDNIELQPLDKILIFSGKKTAGNGNYSLNDFLFTESELLEKEKDLAEKKYEDNLFWEQYSENSKPINPFKEVDKAEEAFNSAKQTLLELKEKDSAGQVESRELNIFSRERLLKPVIDKLTRQATLSKPQQLIEIDGAVKFPGTYPLPKKGTVIDLIEASGGLLESAYLNNLELSRNDITQEGAIQQLIRIDLRKEQLKIANMTLLQSKDRLNVNHIPAWQKHQTIELRGEFKFPGKYTVRRGDTLAELINRAGGFTDYADIKASLFTREKLKRVELQNLIEVSENLRSEIASKTLSQRDGAQALDYEQANMLLADLTKVDPVGRLVIDIDAILVDASSDIFLEDGDILYVSPKQNTVNVVGQVQMATSHIFKSGLTAFDYINLSGGSKKQADEERIFIIKANGSVEIPSNGNWFSSENASLQPGDTVVVPLDSYFMDDLALWQSVTQILYQASVAVAAITRL